MKSVSPKIEFHHPLRVAISGGTSAGKSTLLKEILNRHGDTVVGVEEVTTKLLSERPHYDPHDIAQRRNFQAEVFRQQIAMEEESRAKALMSSRSTIATDRGTIDGCAYWPDGPEAFWRAMDTSPEHELARYDVVVFMRSSARIGMYRAEAGSLRWDSPDEALAFDDAILALWARHPRVHVVAPCRDFSVKIGRAMTIFSRYLALMGSRI